ncbi:MAG: bifunctional demethylmenaquinone methyltransferase/2-methoxy-6-polyprenyl-1,4-benzoquinol methylase UbiE [Hyphomicrobiales bacterium]|nr:bifunctional demethylmenaquinone methyltransferase/2-methoxy-6-polyprenyl-1,4-benzoquinol methylase UbiE [Hyphomicrobiales bacterium]
MTQSTSSPLHPFNQLNNGSPHNGDNARVSDGEEMATSYGFQKISGGEKQPLVNDVFHKVASRYDVMNDMMSAGMHRLWKNAMVATLTPPKSSSSDWHCLDVAGGTGDIAMRIVEASNRQVKATVFDINSSMLEVGKDRAAANGLVSQIEFIEGNAEDLPFETGSFDAYTIAFGIRNVPDINKALGEAFRVLKPGGRFLCLEFSEVDVPMLDKFYDQWSMHIIPKIGKMVTGDGEPYQYLVESVRKFPDQPTFAAMIAKAGFEKVSFQNYTGGVAALHSGWKI